MTKPPATNHPVSERRVAIIGALLVMLGPVSLSLYTPAMPTMVVDFGTTASLIQLSITAYFLGFAVTQLICGPLSDAFGRRPVVLAFLALYLVGSLVAAAAPTIDWLLAGRALQGIGVAAGVAISRAIIRDLFTGQTLARILNLIGLILAIAPAVSPLLGGIIVLTLGWHSIFLSMLIFGLIVMAAYGFGLPETKAEPDKALARPDRVLSNYNRLLTDRAFMRAGLVIAPAVGGIYTQATLLPFVLIERVGLSPAQFGMATIIQTFGYALGSFITGRLLHRIEAAQLIHLGIAIIMTAATLLAGMLQTLPLSVAIIMGPGTLWAFGVALIMPGTMTNALAGFGAIAGSASALLGFMQLSSGFVGSGIAALIGDTTLALSLLLPAMASATAIAHFTLRPK